MKCAFQKLTLLAILSVTIVTASAEPTPSEFPFQAPFELGTAEFAPGDNITITALHGTRNVITTNETYCVEGVYSLSSHDEARLAFYATVPNSGPTPDDPLQWTNITKGSGTFRLIKRVNDLGYLHVSFYDGNNLGGVYFGQGEWVLRNSFNHPNNQKPQAIFEYLGNPVAPPADLDPAYTKSELSNTINLAARNAGISLEKIEIDESEFPCLVGVISEPGDFDKLAAQIKTLLGEFSGSVGNSKCHAFNIVPWRAFPADTAQRIGRRLGVREEMLYDKLCEHAR